MARCLVTGVAGFIGSHLAQALLAQGWRVTGVDCLTDYYDRRLKRANLSEFAQHTAFQWVEGDLNNLDLAALLKDVDVVFHEAGQPGVRGSWGTNFAPYVRNNIEATQLLLEGARKTKIEKFVYASSSSVYGRAPLPMREDGPTHPCSPYGVTKLAAEQLCLTYAGSFGLPVVALRYFSVYGPRQRPDMAFARFLHALHADEDVVIFGDGKQTRDFTYVADAVEATVQAALRGAAGEVYNIGGGAQVTLLDGLSMLERITGRTGRVTYRPGQEGDVTDTLADTAKARADLGFAPRVDLQAGLERQAKWFEERRRDPQGARAPAQEDHRAPSRILLYSHDTYGLGHLRRNLAIAGHLLQRDPPYSVLLLTGSPVIEGWPKPPGLRVQPLPAVVKVGAEQYATFDGDVSFKETKARREALIIDTIRTFQPHLFLVDHAPAGMKGELVEALKVIRQEFPSMRTVLGLRDILDSAEVVRSLWREQGIYELLDTHYDRILVYGCANLFDVVSGYELPPAVAAKVRYCGYVARAWARRGSTASDGALANGSARPTVLVTAGGGGDGYPLLEAYLRSLDGIPPGAALSVVVAGPLMPPEKLQALEERAARRSDVRLIPYTTELLHLLLGADLVVAMGGYNTTAEIVANGKAAILVPRAAPRAEQRMRAALLHRLGLAWIVQPEEDVPARLSELMLAALAGARPPRSGVRATDLGGLEQVGEAVDDLVGTGQRPAARQVHA